MMLNVFYQAEKDEGWLNKIHDLFISEGQKQERKILMDAVRFFFNCVFACLLPLLTLTFSKQYTQFVQLYKKMYCF